MRKFIDSCQSCFFAVLVVMGVLFVSGCQLPPIRPPSNVIPRDQSIKSFSKDQGKWVYLSDLFSDKTFAIHTVETQEGLRAFLYVGGSNDFEKPEMYYEIEFPEGLRDPRNIAVQSLVTLNASAISDTYNRYPLIICSDEYKFYIRPTAEFDNPYNPQEYYQLKTSSKPVKPVTKPDELDNPQFFQPSDNFHLGEIPFGIKDYLEKLKIDLFTNSANVDAQKAVSKIRDMFILPPTKSQGRLLTTDFSVYEDYRFKTLAELQKPEMSAARKLYSETNAVQAQALYEQIKKDWSNDPGVWIQQMEYHLPEFLLTPVAPKVLKEIGSYYFERADMYGVARTTALAKNWLSDEEFKELKVLDEALKQSTIPNEPSFNNDQSVTWQKSPDLLQLKITNTDFAGQSKTITLNAKDILQQILTRSAQKEISTKANAYFFSNVIVHATGIAFLLVTDNEGQYDMYFVSVEKDTGSLQWFSSLGTCRELQVEGYVQNFGERYVVLTNAGALYFLSPGDVKANHPSYNLNAVMRYPSAFNSSSDFRFFLRSLYRNNLAPEITWNKNRVAINPRDSSVLFVLDATSLKTLAIIDKTKVMLKSAESIWQLVDEAKGAPAQTFALAWGFPKGIWESATGGRNAVESKTFRRAYIDIVTEVPVSPPFQNRPEDQEYASVVTEGVRLIESILPNFKLLEGLNHRLWTLAQTDQPTMLEALTLLKDFLTHAHEIEETKNILDNSVVPFVQKHSSLRVSHELELMYDEFYLWATTAQIAKAKVDRSDRQATVNQAYEIAAIINTRLEHLSKQLHPRFESDVLMALERLKSRLDELIQILEGTKDFKKPNSQALREQTKADDEMDFFLRYRDHSKIPFYKSLKNRFWTLSFQFTKNKELDATAKAFDPILTTGGGSKFHLRGRTWKFAHWVEKQEKNTKFHHFYGHLEVGGKPFELKGQLQTDGQDFEIIGAIYNDDSTIAGEFSIKEYSTD